MKNKIREIVKEELKRYKICEDKELSSTFASLIAHKIIEITRLDEEKVEKLVYSTIGVDRKTMKFSKDICSQQDELTKKE